ncbi:MAG TPA: histidine kinase [Flavisolibacter sp.]|jgi:hypothetical protein|nr:histidine kinase [Flavisolibacter sp.]
MTLQTFIFSYKPQHRLARHASFWAVLCLLKLYSDLYGDSFSDVFAPGSFKQSFSSLICFLPLYVFVAYSFICILVPRYLQKRRYAAFILAAFVVVLCNFIAGIFLSLLHFKILDWHMTGTDISLAPIRTSIYQGVILAFMTTGGLVTAIKITKSWYLQQIENTKLARLKSEKEIKLFKAHIQPGFLCQSLYILRNKISCCEDDAPEMLLQLSELLSHLLYDADTELIPLSLELKMVKLFVDIKKFNKQRNLQPTISAHDDETKKYISPLVLFSYLQTALNNAEKDINKNNELVIVLTIENEKLLCGLQGFKPVVEFPIFNLAKKSEPIEMSVSRVFA